MAVFFRGPIIQNYKKDEQLKTAKIILWSSDFQLNRLRLI